MDNTVRFIVKGVSDTTLERVNNVVEWCHVKRDGDVLVAPTESAYLDFMAQLPYSVKTEREDLGDAY